MRQIIFLALLLPTIGNAIPILNYEISQDASQQSLGYSTGRLVNQRVNLAQTSITVADTTFKENYNYSVGIVALRPDYSMTLIRDEFGNETTLDQLIEKRDEYNLNTSFGYGYHGHSVDFGVNTYLTNSPFKTQTFNVGYRYSFYNSTTTLGAAVSTTKQSRPEDYYTQPLTFNVIKRPNEINTDSLSLTLDQVLGARVKGSLEYTHILESEERPTQDKLDAKIGFALTESTFLKGGVGYYIEDDSIEAKNERGFFEAYSFETELVYEYEFDHLISIGYDLVVEDETFKYNNSIVRTAFDQYGLGLRSIWTDLITTNFRFRYAESNFDTKELYFVGGLEWSL